MSTDQLFEEATKYLPDIVHSLDPKTLLYFYARFKQVCVDKKSML